MIRTLLKKQLMESFSYLFIDTKKKEAVKGRSLLLSGAIFALLFASIGAMFFGMAKMLCEPLTSIGFGWLYFALMSLMGLVLGVVGSIFTTYASLYTPKDNDLLLAMPIPTWLVLLTRLFGVYIAGLIYELAVMVPAVIVWFIDGDPSLAGIVFSVLLPLVLSFFVLTLSCVLGYFVALIATKFKRKNLITVVLALAFIGAYMYAYSRIYELLLDLLTHAENVANGVKNVLYPFYQLGLAATGDALAMLIFTAMVAGAFALVYLLLAHNFLALATTKRGAGSVKQTKKSLSAGSMDTALFKKELRRFTGSTAYMLNCALGSVFMVIGGVFLLIKGTDLIEPLSMLLEKEHLVLIALAALLAIVATNDITAPSVSLEGKNLWLVQVMPIPAWRVLRAKLRLHLLITAPPAAFLTLSALIVLKPDAVWVLLTLALVTAFLLLTAGFGLVMNLLFPNLAWANEVVPIKQSMSVTVTLFGGWAMVAALGGLWYLTRKVLSPTVFVCAVLALLAVATVLLYVWLFKRGTKRFENL